MIIGIMGAMPDEVDQLCARLYSRRKYLQKAGRNCEKVLDFFGIICENI